MVIFYVDDDQEDCEFFCEALKEIDPKIRYATASNGQEALQSLSKANELPNYIFLDINMPLMNGKACLVELKKNERFKHIPVVMYSTTSHTTEIKECYSLGAFDFLIKPNDFQKLCTDLISIFAQLRRELR